MKTLYIECNMGAAGDMLMAALSELIPDPEAFVERMNGLGLPGVRFERKSVVKCGITGTHMAVTVDGREEHEHHHGHGHGHHGLRDIRHVIGHLDLSEAVKSNAGAVYDMIARAEAGVHGVPVDQVHFHEVGALDAVADVVGACLLMDMIRPGRVVVSPVHVGCGEVRCAHGVLPVPAPATARILEGVPIYGGQVRGELCTPTGAALLRYFADEFGDMPVMAVERTGYGMGAKDFERANCVRAMLGQTMEGAEDVTELRCNLDDMTGEALGFALETLMREGALDAWCEAIAMKKGRPGQMLCCLCRPGDEYRFAQLMLRYTTTLGVRCQTMRRYALEREAVTLESPWGPVRGKRASGHGVERVKPEFDDVAELAKKTGAPPAEIASMIGK